jgi:membrane associated rhomboid family serine protease/ribosomal protein L37AE/L43A
MDTKPHCPRCSRTLEAKRTRLGIHYECPGCGGRSVALSIARRQFDEDVLKNLWLAVKEAPPVHNRDALACPYCRKKMHPLDIDDGTNGFQIDVCRSCQALWLDATEGESMPARAGGEVSRFLPNGYAPAPGDTESIHRARVEAIRASEATGVPRRTTPETLTGAIFSYLGLPVEEDPPPASGRPWVTWSLIGLCVFVFALQFTGEYQGFVRTFSYTPSHGLFGPGLLTSFFLHGGFLHLLGNMWFLHLVGDNVESRLGPFRYLLLVMAATAAGALAHGALEPQRHVPLVGASAGISGLMVYYALCWPKSRLLIGMRVSVFPFWFSMGAGWAVAFWLGLQLLGALLQVAGMGNVSYLGHLGGAAIGVLAFLLPGGIKFRRGPRPGDFSDPAAVARQRKK